MDPSQFRHTLAEAQRRGPRPVATRLRALVLTHPNARAALADLGRVAGDDARPFAVRLAALHAAATAASITELPLPDGVSDAVLDAPLVDAALADGFAEAIIGALRQLPVADAGLRFVRVMVGRRLLAARRFGSHVTQLLLDGHDDEAAIRAAAAHFVELAPQLAVPPAPAHAAWARLAIGWMRDHETMFAGLCRELVARGDGLAAHLADLIDATPHISTTSRHAARSLLVPNHALVH